jgi:hypothetical protein
MMLAPAAERLNADAYQLLLHWALGRLSTKSYTLCMSKSGWQSQAL